MKKEKRKKKTTAFSQQPFTEEQKSCKEVTLVLSARLATAQQHTTGQLRHSQSQEEQVELVLGTVP